MDRFREQDPLWSELRTPPLNRPGFTEELKRRIESSLTDDARSPRRHRRLGLMTCAGGVIAIAAFAVFAWLRPDIAPGADTAASSSETSPPPSVQEQVRAPMAQRMEPDSGLLIGLRRDRPVAGAALDVSEYRTLWIAPERNRLAVKAEGAGLLVPYRLDFWTVIGITEADRGRAVHRLSAELAAESRLIPAGSRPETPLIPAESGPEAQLIYSEQVAFVANRYIAVEQTVLRPQHEDGQTEKVHFVEMLDDVRSGVKRAIPLERFVVNRDENPDSKADAEATNWTPVRHNGKWVPQMSGRLLPAFELAEELVSHDALCLPWEEVAVLRQDATDALCSPRGDMLVLVTEEQLLVYPLDEDGERGEMLAVPLHDGEMLVMAQWAIGDYVHKWTELTRKFLR